MNDRRPDSPDPTGAGEPAGASWSPPAGLVALAWVAAAAAVVWCVLVAGTADRAGLLLAVVAALGLGLAAVSGTRARPRLRVDASGVTVGGLAGARHHPWAQVDDVRVLAVRRLGRTSTMLEIDVTDPEGSDRAGPGRDSRDPDPDGRDPDRRDPDRRARLLVFGRLDLGDDPEDVAEVVRAARRAATGAG